MEDYMRGILCGYLSVQLGVKDDAKKRRMFLVLSDSRLDYYDVDPRPAFEQDIADAYIFTPATRVHYYVEINPKAPVHSLCLTADKMTHVFTAETDQEAQIWYKHLHERLEALTSMVTGSLMLRKEISVHQQFKRMLLKTKYKWKRRYIELGRSSLRFCKDSEKTTRMMKQFMLTAQSSVNEESVEFHKQHRVLASYATAIEPDAKMLSRFKREMRDQHYASATSNNNSRPAYTATTHKTRNGVTAAFPFVVTTGQAHLYLAAPSESARADWIVAIRMRIISLKYRHNGGASSKLGNASAGVQLQAFMDVQLKPGGDWKQHFVELDNNILRVKGSERKVGAKFESPLVPTCHAAPSLLKANAFVVRNLGKEVALAPSSMREAERWMTTLLGAGTATSVAKYQKVFEDDVRALLEHSVVYSLVVPAGESAGLVVERYKKRIVVLSHEPPVLQDGARTASGGALSIRGGNAKSSRSWFSRSASSAHTQRRSAIPPGSALVAISQFDMAHESFETIWHHVRHKKGYQHPMTLTFRVPAMKQGVAGVRLRPRDPWTLCRCVLKGGKLLLTSLATPGADTDPASAGQTSSHRIMADLPLRHCRVELASEPGCVNGIRVTLSGSSASALATTVLMNVAADADAFLWFALLHLEAAIAQDDFRYPLSVASLVHSKSKKRSQDVHEDQRRCFRACSVVGVRIDDIERLALETDPLTSLRSHNDEDRDRFTSEDGAISAEAAYTTVIGHAGTSERELSEAESTAFFQHLDAIGCGKVPPATLVRAIDELTRHIPEPATLSSGPDDGSVSLQATKLSTSRRHSGTSGVLEAFYRALDDRMQTSAIALTEFLALMRHVRDARVVDVVQKVARHDIQCL